MVSTRSGRVVGGAAAPGGEHGPLFGATTTASKAPRTKQPDLHADMDNTTTSQQVQTAPAAPEGAEQPMRMAFVEQQVLLSPRGTPAVKAVHAAAHAAVASPRTAQQLSSMPLPDADEEETHARAAGMGSRSPPSNGAQAHVGPGRGASSAGAQAHGPPPRMGHRGGGKMSAPAGRLLAAVLFVAALATGALLAVNTCDPQLVASARLPPQLRALLPAPAPASPACVAARVQLDHLRQRAADAAHALRPYTYQLSATISRLQTQFHNLAKDLLSRFQPEQKVSAPEPTPTQRPLPHVALRQRLHDLIIGGLLEEHEAVNAAAAAAAAAPSTIGPSLLDAWHAAAGHAAAKRKALGLLLACNSQGACDRAVTRLSSPPGVDAGSAGGGAEGGAAAAAAACTAVVSVSELGSGAGGDGEQGSGTDAAGRLQRRLAALLARCGGSGGGSGDAVIVVSGLDAAPLPLVAVLNNALSESGNLQLDGASVDMHAAAFVFPIVVAGPQQQQQQQQQAQESQGSDGEEGAAGAGGEWVAQEDEEESAEGFERRVKDMLAARLAGSSSGAVEVGAGGDGQGTEAGDAPAAATPALPAVVRALRRRIDLVMRVKAD